MLEIDELTVLAAGHPVVSSASVRVPRGRILGVAGATPAARTNVLLAIAGHGPREGTIRIDGQEVSATGIVTRDHTLIGSLTAVENVAVSLFVASGPQRDDWPRIETLLGALLLPEASWHNLVENLSGGQQQRVALARALVVRHGFVCLDAPVSELDADSTSAARDRIRAASDDGCTVVMTVQGPGDESLCDEILRL